MNLTTTKTLIISLLFFVPLFTFSQVSIGNTKTEVETYYNKNKHENNFTKDGIEYYLVEMNDCFNTFYFNDNDTCISIDIYPKTKEYNQKIIKYFNENCDVKGTSKWQTTNQNGILIFILGKYDASLDMDCFTILKGI